MRRALPASTKPSTSHRRSPGGERGVEKGSGRRSTLEGRNIPEDGMWLPKWGTFLKEKQKGRAHLRFPELLDTVLSWSEVKCANIYCFCYPHPRVVHEYRTESANHTDTRFKGRNLRFCPASGQHCTVHELSPLLEENNCDSAQENHGYWTPLTK